MCAIDQGLTGTIDIAVCLVYSLLLNDYSNWIIPTFSITHEGKTPTVVQLFLNSTSLCMFSIVFPLFK